MTEIGVGLVGFGLGGRVFHAPFIEATAGLALRAVVSGNPEKVHAQLPGMMVVPSVEALLALPGIDLVVISSPDDFHAAHAMEALSAGKHVLIDKPFATNLADAQRICAAAKRADRMVTVFHNRRWDADFLTLKRLISQGKLGRIVHFESHFDRWKPEALSVWKEARTGGSWLDLGPHLVDQAICLFGKPDAITADVTTLRDGAPAPDWFHAILHYPEMRAVLHSSKLSADHRLRFAVHGTGGSWIKHGLDTQEAAIVAGASPGDPALGEDPLPGIFIPAEDPDRSEQIPNERGDYGLFWRALALALAGKGSTPLPTSDAICVMEVLDAGLESALKGMTIQI
ncbi:oxidoreductase [Novosphingobium aquae]|uniref:Oxidoreductase n=1 Tax=Novosphingobium aquae TaxID=3133435 RepID=A0ABU8S622_9SPHN